MPCLSIAFTGYAIDMTDVVDSDELLRRIQRARACAAEEEQSWRARSDELQSSDPQAAREAAVRTLAYEAVTRVLDEVVRPGSRSSGPADRTD
ncbi:hypothetical protein RKD27_008713 [Streptomyces sp. SAI-126]